MKTILEIKKSFHLKQLYVSESAEKIDPAVSELSVTKDRQTKNLKKCVFGNYNIIYSYAFKMPLF